MRTILVLLMLLAIPAFAIPGLVGYWPMDEGTGAIVDECSGASAGGEGRVLGTVAWEDTERGPGLVFDGKSTAVKIPGSPDWDFGEGELTISLWVKLNPGAGGFILDHYFSGTPGVWGIVVEGAPTFALYDDARKPVKLRFPGFRNSQWHQLTIVWKRAKDGWLRAYLDGKPVQTLDNVVSTARYPFDLYVGGRQGTDQFSAGRYRDLAIFNRALTDDEIGDLYLNGLTSATPVVISSLKTNRLLYGPKETGTATVRVKNLTEKPQAVRLALTLTSGLYTKREIDTRDLTLPAKTTQTVTVPLAFIGEDYGCDITAAVTQAGKALAEKRDVFSVSDSFFKVGIGSDWGGGLHTANGQYTVIPEMARKLYSNYFELFFWSPCDWALHVAPQKAWWSGQASYAENEDNLIDLINSSHAQGIKVMMYANSNPAGPFGWEAARAHPQWFGGGGFGRTGNYQVEALEKWNDPEWRKTVKGNPGWFLLPVDLRREDAVASGIDRIIDVAKKYGWDGVRFDGHYTIVGNDEMSTRNMRRLKERAGAAVPGFHFGFNYGRAPEWLGGVSHEMREGMAGGGYYLQEGIRNWRYTADQYASWQHYRANELRIAKLVYGMGGYYHCMWGDQRLTPAQAYYKLVYGLIAGGHPADSGIYANTPGSANWGAFMTRWSAILWHPHIVAAPKTAERITVQGDGLAWKELVQERVISPTRKYVILHVVDPSPEDAIAKTTFPAPKAADATVRISYKPVGEKIVGGTVVCPDRPLTVTGNNGELTTAWPKQWMIVVFEVEGKYSLPKTPPAFTEAPDPAKLVWSADQALTTRTDPNIEDTNTAPTNPNDILVSLATGGVNIGRVTTIDPGSPQGSVQWRAKDKASSAMGKFWTGPYAPGRYKAVIRLKWADPNAEPTPQMLTMRVEAEKGEKLMPNPVVFVTPGYPNAPAGAVTLGERGAYRDYLIGEFDTKKSEYFTFAGQASTTQVGEHTLYAEKIVVTLLERYTDAQQEAWNAIEKPAGLPTPQGRAPKNTLVIRGLFTKYYGLDAFPGATQAYAVPKTYAELYAFDAVVLANVDFSTSAYPVRRLLKDYVEDGGRLVLLGGNRALGEGGLKGTYLETMAPFVLKGAGEVAPCTPPVLLGSKAGTPDATKPTLFWRHDVTLKPGATAVAFAGAQPIAARIKFGNGLVTVFAGTVLGEGANPFWTTAWWTKLLGALIIE